MALVDVRSRAWPLLYANHSFAREEGGGDVGGLTDSGGFWSLFEPAESGVTVSAGGGARGGGTAGARQPGAHLRGQAAQTQGRARGTGVRCSPSQA